MSQNKEGVITIIETIVNELTILIDEIRPFIEQTKPIDHNHVQQHLDNLVTKMQGLTDKTHLTYELIQVVINSIHSSRNELKKSVDGLLKKTGVQLKKITTTTEEATNKILDVAEELDAEQLVIIEKLDSLKSNNNQEDIIEDIKKMIFKNQDAAFTIIDYLQFQDITAQQISGAYALLSDTEKTLLYVSNLLKEFDFGEEGPEIVLPEIDPKSFNANAIFIDKGNIQNLIDDLFETGDTDIDIPNDHNDIELKDLQASVADSEDDFDIDALFNDNNSGNQASQDDIDKLFS
ncbi:MAG: hypothetical protein RBS16_04625 [Candidatus Cloacimonadales bacterium]|nr:hypothetical protein [Candidatus Cloacimonadota bacterium]MDD2649724.1 hypothetical protein [Candidatus Cloacimonadota bacterium]MDD3500796.1 hypothetical protein [Candidatus Cloacimonadota bacterium]MDX9977301.1 hypothetical protein [Candidatus Cloacimonadales bacterium]